MEADESFTISLHVYDLTRGMARAMSAVILGKIYFLW